MRLEVDGLVKITDGFFVVLHFQVHEAAIQIALGIVGLDLNDVVEVPKRAIQLPEHEINAAALLITPRETRVALNDLKIIQEGVLRSFQPPVSVASLEVSVDQ